MSRHVLSLAFLGTCLVAACSDAPPQAEAAGTADTPAESGVAAYRVREDFDAPLNADTGWSAGLSEPATMVADRPFRLRMELDPAGDLDTGCLRLQYRRNGGDWTQVGAHDFPYPLRKRELTFEEAEAGTIPGDWRVVEGEASGLTVTEADAGRMLTASAGDASLITLYPAPWDLEGAFSFAAEYRLADRGPASLGLVFGYVDAANHWRLVLDAEADVVRVVRVQEGTESVVAQEPADVRTNAWQAAEVELEDDALQISFNDEEVEFELPAPGNIPAEHFGFRLPESGHADFRAFLLEGEPSSPRTSIVSTDAYADGTDTQDLLAGAASAYVAGTGVSLDECAPATVAAGEHAEVEWPLVIRRFADAAATNLSGDTFEFRMTDSAGEALAGAPTARITLDVPAGHLGGTFVEAPGRIGPWQAGNGDLYFVMEPAESDNLFMMVKSTDGGRSWHEVDGAHRPATGDLESVDGHLVGDTVHLLHQVSESTRYHAFRTSDHPEAPDTWAVTDELATAVTARAQMATLAVRPDDSLVAFHVGDTVGYSIRSPGGQWSDEVVVDGGGADLAGPQAVVGAGGVVHLAYYRMDGTIWYRRLLPDDTLTEAQRLDRGVGTSEDEWGAVLPLVYLPESDTVVVLYRLADGKLRERRITGNGALTPPVVVAERRVVQHAVDSQQVGADAVAYDDGVVVLFIDETDRGIYSTMNRGEGWEPPTLQVDDILGSWVRGNVIRRADGATVYGYVYDAGSYGGAGMNRYGELVLDAPQASKEGS